MIDSTKMAAVSFEPIVSGVDGAQEGWVLTFAGGRQRSVKGADLTRALQQAALFHGLKQKLGDAAAIPRNTDTGRSATNAEKAEAVCEVLDRLLAGEWNKTREGGETGAGVLLTALVNLYPKKTREALTAWLAGLDKDARAKIRKNPTVAAEMLRIRSERAAAGAEGSGDLLSELENDEAE